MNKLTIYGIVFLFLLVGVSALVFEPYGFKTYLVTFNSGTQAIVSNMNYDKKSDTVSMDVQTLNGTGLKMSEIKEGRDFLLESTGRANKFTETTEVRITYE